MSSSDAGSSSTVSLASPQIQLTTPHTETAPSQSQTPGPRTPSTPLSSTDTNIPNWHVKFNVETLLDEMMNGNRQMKTHIAAKCLREGRPLTAACRNELIRCITDGILQ